ncbi:unnamed protein product, partial [Polarella glacialis]
MYQRMNAIPSAKRHNSTISLVVMTFASHAEGRQLDPGMGWFVFCTTLLIVKLYKSQVHGRPGLFRTQEGDGQEKGGRSGRDVKYKNPLCTWWGTIPAAIPTTTPATRAPQVVTHTTARKVVKDVVSMLQNHYPECSGRMIIINAPKVFSIAWSFIKPMLDDRTVAKISIFGADQRETWVNALLELVDADQLPALFGGRCLCDGHDQVSCMRSTKGPWADPAVMAMVEESGFANVLTPGGAKLLHERRQAAAEAAEEAEAA